MLKQSEIFKIRIAVKLSQEYDKENKPYGLNVFDLRSGN